MSGLSPPLPAHLIIFLTQEAPGDPWSVAARTQRLQEIKFFKRHFREQSINLICFPS